MRICLEKFWLLGKERKEMGSNLGREMCGAVGEEAGVAG